MTESKTILTYTNRLGDVYYFRKTDGGRGGEQIVASRKCSEDALDSLPRGMEIAEHPNGKVSCRKKMKSVILPAEIHKVKAWIPKLKKQAWIAVELKPNAIVVHSAPIPKLPITLIDVVLKQILKELPSEQRAETRRFRNTVTDSVRGEARIRQCRKPDNMLLTATDLWWIWIWRNSSTG